MEASPLSHQLSSPKQPNQKLPLKDLCSLPLMEKPHLKSTPPPEKRTTCSWPAAPQQKRLPSPTAGLLPLTACKIPSISFHTCCFPIRPSTPLS